VTLSVAWSVIWNMYQYELLANWSHKLAWPLISNFSCPPAPAPCTTSSNKGWRYFLLAAGGIVMVMWIIRFFVFNVQESPKCLVSHGKDEIAVAVVHRVARINGAKSNLTVEQLKEAEMVAGGSIQNNAPETTMRKLSKFYASHVRTPFATRKLAYSTSILIALWGESRLLLGSPNKS